MSRITGWAIMTAASMAVSVLIGLSLGAILFAPSGPTLYVVREFGTVEWRGNFTSVDHAEVIVLNLGAQSIAIDRFLVIFMNETEEPLGSVTIQGRLIPGGSGTHVPIPLVQFQGLHYVFLQLFIYVTPDEAVLFEIPLPLVRA